MNDCMWQIVVDGEFVCIPAEPVAGKLARCERGPDCGYQARITAEEYRNAPRISDSATK